MYYNGINNTKKRGLKMKQKSPSLTTLGIVLKELRLQNDLTLEEVAEKLGVTHKAVQFWEQGFTEIKLTRLVQLASIYNSSVDDVLNRAGFC